MVGLSLFAQTAIAPAMGIPSTSLLNIQRRAVNLAGVFPRAQTTGRGSGPAADPKNCAKLLLAWVTSGQGAERFANAFYDLECAEIDGDAERFDPARHPARLLGGALERILAEKTLAATIDAITFAPAIASALVETRDGGRLVYGRPPAFRDSVLHLVRVSGRPLFQIGDALAASPSRSAPMIEPGDDAPTFPTDADNLTSGDPYDA